MACASHVQQLLSKLPPEQVANYIRHSRTTQPGEPYNLVNFFLWLQEEADCQAIVGQVGVVRRRPNDRYQKERKLIRQYQPTTTILHGVSSVPVGNTSDSSSPIQNFSSQRKELLKFQCPFCKSGGHHLSRCQAFSLLDLEDMRRWIKENHCCWRCGRAHQASRCDLKKGCPKCKGKHLGILHEVNQKSASGVFFLGRPSCSPRVLLKVVKLY